MATGIDLISRALRRVGALASGQTADGTDIEEALAYLNDMLEEWSIEDLMVYYQYIITHTLVAGTNSYTLGPTGVIVAVRPIEILSASIQTSDGLDLPIQVVPFDTYDKYIQKTTTPTQPNILAYQPAYPNGTIYIWPTPSAGYTLRIQINAQFSAISDVTSEIALPLGYSKAIVNCLADELCLDYGKPGLAEEIKERARISKMLIKRKNTRKNTLSIDPAFLMANRGTYNPYSDT